MNVAALEHGLGLGAPGPRLETGLDSALGSADDFAIGSAHSKSCVFGLSDLMQESFEPIKTVVSSFPFVFRQLTHA
jgi:hypothetical protein